jgi:hypothetical protein
MRLFIPSCTNAHVHKVSVLVHSVRLGQANRTVLDCCRLQSALKALAAMRSAERREQELSLLNSLTLLQRSVADNLSTPRHYIQARQTQRHGLVLCFDPRLMVFEFAQDICLRKAQVLLIDKFMTKVASGESMVNQMIMGAGKTTVVGPLLALLLADGKSLVMRSVCSSSSHSFLPYPFR